MAEERCANFKKEVGENKQHAHADHKKEIIKLLHEFNEVKDATQIVLGVLANIEGVTIKKIHKKFNLPIQ